MIGEFYRYREFSIATNLDSDGKKKEKKKTPRIWDVTLLPALSHEKTLPY